MLFSSLFSSKSKENIFISQAKSQIITFPNRRDLINLEKSDFSKPYPLGKFEDYLNVYGTVRLYLLSSPINRAYILRNILGFHWGGLNIDDKLHLTYEFIHDNSRYNLVLCPSGEIELLTLIDNNGAVVKDRYTDETVKLLDLFLKVYHDINHINFPPDVNLSKFESVFLKELTQFEYLKNLEFDSMDVRSLHSFIIKDSNSNDFPSKILLPYFTNTFLKEMNTINDNSDTDKDTIRRINSLKNKPQSKDFSDGINYLKSGLFKQAAECFSRIDEDNPDYPRGLYNLSMFNSEGCLDYIDIDKSAELLVKAQTLGHQMASLQVKFLEASDRSGFGLEDLNFLAVKEYVSLSSEPLFNNMLAPFLNLFLCRTYYAITKKFGVASEFVSCCFAELTTHSYEPIDDLILEHTDFYYSDYDLADDITPLISENHELSLIFSYYLKLFNSLGQIIQNPNVFFCQMISIPWYINYKINENRLPLLPGLSSPCWD